MEILITVSSILFVILCVLMIIIILLQSDKSAGMGILGGSSQSTFGSSTADIITKITTVMVALFMLGSLGLAILQSYKERAIEKDLLTKDVKSSGVVEKTDKPAKDDGVKKNLPDKEKNK
jgi:preprotein translocase subunit SecG